MRANSSRSGLRSAFLIAAALCAPLTTPAYDLLAPVSLWPVGDVNWKENLIGNGTNIPVPSGGSPLQDGSTTWGQALQKAFDDLNAVLPDQVLTLSLTQNSGIPAGNQNGVNNVAFAPTIYGDAWGGSTVGISLSLWTGNRKTENDVLFNSTKTWDSYEGPQQNGITDLRRIALHEFGHSLGLDHPDGAGQVVNAIMNSVSSDIDELQQDDIDGLLSIYGAIMPVVISAHPQSYTTPVGGSWPFSIVASGSELITYDWEQSTNGGSTWTDIGFSSSTTMGSLSSLGTGQNGMQIRVNVTNPAGMVTSNVATLTVTASAEAPAITSHPSNSSVSAGANTSFVVAASGSHTPTIQWQSSSNGGVSWSNVSNVFVVPSGPGYSGATTTTLQITGAISGINGRQYRAVATNTAGAATSNAATLTVSGAAGSPQITAHPSNVTVNAGQPASFAVTATGDATLTYQWKLDNVDISGATSATYNIASAATSDAGTYTVTVTNLAGSATSNGATLTVNTSPSILSHPTNRTAVLGSDVTFSVTASGTNPLSYQWRRNGVNVAGGTSATLALANVQSGNAGTYTCVVTNVAGSATSNSATLTIDSTPRIINVSCLASAGAGDSTLVVGFFISGTGAKTLLIRGVGARLAQAPFNRANVVPDPSITVYNSSQVSVATNNDWNSILAPDFARVGAFELVDGSKDAALKITLAPGLYTVHLVNSAPVADGLIEVYDFSRDSGTRLTNVSCRLNMKAGELVILGTALIANPRPVLARAVGPGLAPYVSEPLSALLADPFLRVYVGADEIANNDNWEAATGDYFGPAGAFPIASSSADAAIRVVPTPGSLTIHATGKGGAGIAIIEIYESP